MAGSARGYTPGIGNSPFGNTNTNPQSSNYKNISGQNPSESILIAKAIKKVLFDAAPEQYNALKLLFEKPFKEYNSDEFTHLEYNFARTPMEAGTGNTGVTIAVAAIPGAKVQQTIILTAASITRITPDLLFTYPDGVSKGNIIAITGNNITVNSYTSEGLPAVTDGDIFSIQSTIIGDAMDKFQNYERTEVIERFNFVQFFLRARRWGRIELQKYENNGTTDYLVVDREQTMKQLRYDMFSTFFNGLRGEVELADGTIAKTAGGIYPTMLAAGSASAVGVPLAGVRAAFETLAFATNFKKVGATRFIYATDEMLYDLSSVWKEPGLRYAPSDRIADLNLTQYKLGSMNFVPVSTELFKEPAMFDASWNRRMLVLDQETISPVKMKGIPEMEMGSTLDRKDGGTRETFKDFWAAGQLSVEFSNPLASFIIDGI